MTKILGATIALMLGATILALVIAGPVMLLWGAIAGTYGLPTMGFGTAIQACLLIGILRSLGESSS